MLEIKIPIVVDMKYRLHYSFTVFWKHPGKMAGKEFIETQSYKAIDLKS